MRFVFILFAVACLSQDAPYKPDDEFDIQLSFVLRNQPQDYTQGTQEIDQRSAKRADTQLPALIAKVTLVKTQPEEDRVNVRDQFGHLLLSKKIKGPLTLNIDMGYIADIKDGSTSRNFNIYFMDAKRNALSRIAIEFREGQDFYVNDEKRGAL